jgi:23S rRNA (guanine1835-N2)-methyltransferase
MQIKRYPPTQNKSLRPWSAAEAYMLAYLEEKELSIKQPLIYQDRFGYLSCQLQQQHPVVVLNYRSQEKAILENIRRNNLNEENFSLTNLLTPITEKIDLVLLRIPKSLDLLRFYFQHMSEALSENALVLAGFMTKYFSPKFLSIAAEYFEVVEQTKAWKKARLLVLSQPKAYKKREMVNRLSLDNGAILKQYYGVFSANQLDLGTSFFLEQMQLPEEENFSVLDLAAGNGVIAYHIHQLKPMAELHLIDDSYLAVQSAKMNLGEGHHYYYNDRLEDFEEDSIDFVVSNPPFHFEYETNIEVSLNLFRDVSMVLRKGGVFQLVANKHLNYKTHLQKLFYSVETLAENNKFVVYSCQKEL